MAESSWKWPPSCKRDFLVVGTATIELYLHGVGGLKELSKVTVAGNVAPGSTSEAFVVIASAVFVEQ